MAGIKDVVIVSNAEYISSFKNLLADGTHLGINLSYSDQPKSDGFVGALISAANLVNDSDALIILGDIKNEPLFIIIWALLIILSGIKLIFSVIIIKISFILFKD